MSILTFQIELRPALPNVYGGSDYREFRDPLSQMDHLLGKRGMEEELVVRALKRWEEEDLEGGEKPTEGQRQRQRRMLHYALLRTSGRTGRRTDRGLEAVQRSTTRGYEDGQRKSGADGRSLRRHRSLLCGSRIRRGSQREAFAKT